MHFLRRGFALVELLVVTIGIGERCWELKPGNTNTLYRAGVWAGTPRGTQHSKDWIYDSLCNTYRLSQAGVALGTHTVRITTGGERPDPASGTMKNYPELVPAKYNTASQLKKEIKAGDNEIHFELSGK